MRWLFTSTLIAVTTLLLLLPLHLIAHEGHNDAKKPTASTPTAYFSAETRSDKYEVLVKHGELKSGVEASFILFLSDAETNLPVDSATLTITSPDAAAMTFSVHQRGAGEYEVAGTFPKDGDYGLTIAIDAKAGPDLVLLQSVQVGKELPHAHAEEASGSTGLSTPWAIAIGVLGGALLMLLIARRGMRKTTARATMLLFVGLLIPMRIAFAHEGHDQVKKKGSAPASTQLTVLKETQFLFGVETRTVHVGPMEHGLRMFGTVIPSSSGRAEVRASQPGRIASLGVHVGDLVRKGQVLASIDPSTDAGNTLDLQAQRNAVEAEYAAAKADYDRLKSISDIAAKKDLTEAEARLRTAEKNKQLFAGGGTSFPLISPIEGVLGAFTLSVGSMVQADTPLFTITDLRTVYVEAQVFDRDADFVTADGSYSVECTTDEHRCGNVRLLSLAQEIDPTNQSQRVLFELQDPDNGFKIGEFVTVVANTPSEERGLAVPASAIVELEGRPVVFIKDAAEQYSISYVKVGMEGARNVPILLGVEDGERVVVNAAYELKMMYLNQ